MASSASSATPGIFDRETWGYHTPVIPPESIIRPAQFSLAPEAITGNLLLAILIAAVMGLSGVILRRLITADELFMKQIFGRLPFQALLTLVILWLLHRMIPAAVAQGFSDMSSVSLLRIPVYAFVFFLVVGTSNYLFNTWISAEGVRLQGQIFGQSGMDEKLWLLVPVVAAYGIVGAHINPEFSLFPGRELGIVLIATLSIIVSVCVKDFVLYGIARSWKMPGWFKANISGFAIAVVCIALSRWFALTPGYIYGIPLGLALASSLSRQREGLFEFLGMTWLLVLTLIVWVAGTFSGAYPVLTDLMNLLFVILAEEAFFSMLPIPALAGGSIFHWKKSLWTLQFVAVVFFLFHTLFNPEGTVMNLAESPPTASALMLIGCFAAGVFLLWGYYSIHRSRLFK